MSSWNGVKARSYRINAAKIVRYPNTGQVIARIYWGDGAVTEGPLDNPHIKALIARCEREGGPVTLIEGTTHA